MTRRIPVIVMAGSDARPGAVPAGMTPDDMLTGLKGALPLPTGRCLVGELVDRLRQSDCCEEPVVIGPQRVYQGLLDAEIVDVDGSLADSLRGVLELSLDRYDPAQPVAVTTCDILPTAADIRQLLQQTYAPHRESVFWYQLVAAQPDQLGASRWKPSYHICPVAGEAPQNMYPGHVVVMRPQAVRLDLTVHLLRTAYRFRNIEMARRYTRVVAHGIWDLLRQDLINVSALQLPVLTLGIPYAGLRAYFKFRRGTMNIADFERALATGFVHRRFHQANHRRPVVCSVTQQVAFAKDIDTKAELAEAVGAS